VVLDASRSPRRPKRPAFREAERSGARGQAPSVVKPRETFMSNSTKVFFSAPLSPRSAALFFEKYDGSIV